MLTSKGYKPENKGYYDPEVGFQQKYSETIVKPYIAQTRLASSYGLMQIMYESAYACGYKGKPEDLTENYILALTYGIKFLASEKSYLTLHANKNLLLAGKSTFSYKDIPPSLWMEIFGKVVVKYNGGLNGYRRKLRENEMKYLKNERWN